MSVKRFNLNGSLSITNCMDFCNEMFNSTIADEYEFDFTGIGWFPPFSMLYLSAQINQFRQERSGAAWTAIGYDRHSYAAHMGFFRSFSLPHGNAPGEAPGSGTYIPLTVIPCAGIRNEAMRTGVSVGEIVEGHAHRLAQMLTSEHESNLFVTLRYSIREMLRNIVEHSTAEDIHFCAQYWATRGMVEIGIYDAGIGLRRALYNNPHLRMESDRDAIRLSLLPGVSGAMYEGIERDPYDAWANSGYGLYMTSRICGDGGSFFIASGDAALLKAAESTTYYNQNFNGTAIRMVLHHDRIRSLSESLTRYAAEGRGIAETIRGVDAFGPSIASTIGRRNDQ